MVEANRMEHFCIEDTEYRNHGLGRAMFQQLVITLFSHGETDIYVIPQREPDVSDPVSKKELKEIYTSLGFILVTQDIDGTGCGNDLYVYHLR